MVELYDKDGVLRAIVQDVDSIEELEEMIKHERRKGELKEMKGYPIHPYAEEGIKHRYYYNQITNRFMNKCGNAVCACTGACRGLKTTTYMTYA